MTATAARSQQSVNEKKLFHGTTPDVVEAICKHNFDWRVHGKNKTCFGEGSYFARDASYSHAYARAGASGSRYMFVAKVLVGSYTKGHSSYRRPPQKIPSDPGSDLYDSCVNNLSNPSVFVVFDTDQLYPEYIITYSTVSQLDSADNHHYSLPQGSTSAKGVVTLLSTPSTSKAQVIPGANSTPLRGILKSLRPQTLASTKTSGRVVSLQSTPPGSQAQVLNRTSATPKATSHSFYDLIRQHYFNK